MVLQCFVYLMVMEVLLGWRLPVSQAQSEAELWWKQKSEISVWDSRRYANRFLLQARQRITITAGPTENAVVNQDDFPFEFEVPGNAQAECLLSKGPTTIRDWFVCTSPLSLTEPLQIEGTYTLRIRIAGDGSSQSQTVVRFHVDLTEPETEITNSTHFTDPMRFSFEFKGVDDDVDHFECDLDYSGRWETCRSPKTYNNLVYGEHVFAVRAVDLAGNADSTPAMLLFQVNHRTTPPSARPFTADPPPPSDTAPSPSPSPDEPRNDTVVDSNSSNASASNPDSSRRRDGTNGTEVETQSPRTVRRVSSNSSYTIIAYIGSAILSITIAVGLVLCFSRSRKMCSQGRNTV